MRASDPAAGPSFAEIGLQWGRICCIGFGGPPAHVALLLLLAGLVGTAAGLLGAPVPH